MIGDRQPFPAAFPGKSVIVIGAGISGLCAAYLLRKEGVSVTVLEKDLEAGGTMKTIRQDGWLIESGPNSALETTPLLPELFTGLGILEERCYASEAGSNRYVVRDGGLYPLPMSPGAFLRTRLWTTRGKLRLLKEPFIGRGTKDESIAEFVTRRLGKEFLDYAINPFVAGVYAGNPETLSVRAAFPKLYALEERYGGLIRGALGSRRERKARKEVAKDRAKLFSFAQGMQTFPNALASALGSSVRYGASVERIVPMRAGRFPVYTVAYTRDGVMNSLEADAVILASPAHATASMIRPIDPDTAAILEAIAYPPVAEVFFGFRAGQINRPLDGFGFLVPAVERRKILGCLWSSALFGNRAPEGYVALTSFAGGARQPELPDLEDEELSNLVQADLRSLMNISGSPVFTRIIRWARAIPQYNLGYATVLQRLDRFEDNFQGAFFCSNFKGGIAVGDCVMSAEKTAQRIVHYLRPRGN